MGKKHKILESRGRLDRTLGLPDLANEELLKSVVRNQLLLSSLSCGEGEMERIVGKRTKDVSNFLEMLRSASENKGKDKSVDDPHIDWKLKQDTDELRVMYCEGAHGSPFHNILAEGFADGHLDVCVCASWEATLYHKWWPEFKLPTFKVLMNTCLNKVRVGEEISLIRVKVPWPISDREALLHYFEIEYLEEDLILILINTISEKEHGDATIGGFSMDGISEPKDAIRIDLVGGVVMQKVDLNRCYFRIIVTMDVKLDFVHPSLINFITRQLVGSGHKLFQKAVSGVIASDEDYCKALEGPMYARIREGMDHRNIIETGAEAADKMKTVMADTSVSEITEETEESENIKTDRLNDKLSIYPAANQQNPNQGAAYISPEVQNAIEILDHCISLLNTYGNHIDGVPSRKEDLPVHQAISEAGIVANEAAVEVRTDMDQASRTSEAKSPAIGSGMDSIPGSGTSSDERFTSSGPEAADSRGAATHDIPARSTIVRKTLRLESMNKVSDEASLEGNAAIQERNGPYTGGNKGRWKKWMYCFNARFARS